MNAEESLVQVKVEKEKINELQVMWILAISGFIIVCNVYTMVPIIDVLTSELHTSKTLASLTTSSFTFFYALGFLFFGPFSEIWGRRHVIVYGLLSMAVITFILSFVHSIEWIIFLRALQGIAAATFAPVALAYVFEIFQLQKRALVIAWISTGFLLSGILGQVISSWITHSIGWNFVFVFFSVVYFIVFILAFKVLPSGSSHVSNVHLVTFYRQMFRFTNRNIVKGYIIAITLFLSFVAMYAALGGYLTFKYGLSEEQILIIRMIGILGMTFTLFSGKFIRTYGLKQTLIAGLICADLGLLLLSVMPNLILLVISSVIFVAGFSLVIPTMIQVIGHIGGAQRGPSLTMYTFLLFLGASIGPFVLQIGDFRTICLILFGILGVSVIFALLLTINKEH